MIDYLVIGGGIAGVSVAARLVELGTVMLLEAEDALGTQTSGRSAAMFDETYGNGAVRALNRASREHLRDAGALSPRGIMLVGTQATAGAFAQDMTAMAMTPIGVDDACTMVPILDPGVITSAGHRADAMDIDTDRLLQGFARTVSAEGGRITTGARVSAIGRRDGLWHVTYADQEIICRHLVNAAGAWADEVAQMAGVAPVGLTPFRRSMARMPAPGGLDPRGWPMIFGAGEAWYAKPDAGALLVSPADEDASYPHDAWADDMVLAEGLARYEAHVNQPVDRVLTNWAGLRTFAPDRTLVLGPDPDVPSFIWCAGQGGYGFQTAPAASRLVADLVAGKTSEIPAEKVEALTPDRLRR